MKAFLLLELKVKRLEWYVQIIVSGGGLAMVQILVKRLLKGGKLQHVRRGISIGKQINKNFKFMIQTCFGMTHAIVYHCFIYGKRKIKRNNTLN